MKRMRDGEAMLTIRVICKWKEKVAALRRDTCRFLLRIVRKVALPTANPEEKLAVIPNEEAIHAIIWGVLSTYVRHFSMVRIKRCFWYTQ
jgi:hypothetical protein